MAELVHPERSIMTFKLQKLQSVSENVNEDHTSGIDILLASLPIV